MARKFDFASPGVQLNEIDQSQVPQETTEDGILLIGTSLKGPAMKPVKIKDLDSFIEVFGAPVAGKPGNNVDVWRDGNRYGPSYAAYAAQAHLAAGTSPVTFIRLLGEEDSNAVAGTDTLAGWNLGGGNADASSYENTLAYGLFLMPSASADAAVTGSLAAVIYATGSAVTLRGIPAGATSGVTSSMGQLIQSQTSGQPSTFKMDVWSSNSAYETYTFHFDPTNKEGYIRNVLNSNPQKINSTNFATTESYFVGESFEQSVKEMVNDISSSAGKQYGILLPLVSGSTHYLSNNRQVTAAKSGWIVSRNSNPTAAPSDYSPESATKLFRVVSLHDGEWMQENYGIKISDLKLGTTAQPDSSFSLSVINKAGAAIETFSNLNLNEGSENFILKKIGDEDRVWDTTNKIFNITGDYPNRSNYIRIEMSDDWKAGLTDSYAIPFGFYGPSKIKPFSLAYGSKGPQTFGDVDNSGTRATNVIADPSSPVAHNQTIIVSVGGSTVLTITTDTGVAYTATPTLSGATHTLGLLSQTTAEQVYTALAYLLNQLDDVSAANDGGTSVTITADVIAESIYDIAITGTYISGGHASSTATNGADSDDSTYAWVKGNNYAWGHAGDANTFASLPTNMSCSFIFPELRLTSEDSKMGGNYNNTDVFGVRHVYGNLATTNRVLYKSGDYSEFLNALPGGLDIHSVASSTEVSFVFSLDDIRLETTTGLWYWESGSMAGGNSYTKANGTAALIKQGVKSFNIPLFGGFDGVDISVVDPFSSAVSLSGQTNKSHYAHYTIDKAIEIAADPESIKYDLVSIPGMVNSVLQNKLIRKVEERGDALAVIDLDDSYLNTFENGGTTSGGEISTTINTANSRDLNTSYAATYAPRLKIRDTLSGNDEVLIVPASVGAIGAMAYSEANSAGPWFAPAGFNRGGLSILGGSSGPRTVGVLKTLSKKQRDELYEVNINPIARFPAVGEIVVFGQKTLQQTPSALDRVNVRRLMIFLKKKIGAIADTILFDQNVQSTWNRFLAQADPILASVQARFGITDYKLILDTSTTTDDLIDRNIMYAKVFVKPAKAIEYIVIDFIVTRTGVEF
jgi:hypothetical protein